MTTSTTLAGISVGINEPVRLMGVINVSPESFYKESVKTNIKAIAKTANQMQKEGADFVDVGAMSTAPYLSTHITEEEEIQRSTKAIRAIKKSTTLPISIDTTSARVARAALNEGATIINDISGLHHDSQMPNAIKKAKGAILMANPAWANENTLRAPLLDTLTIFRKILSCAKKNKIQTQRLLLDPGIGFFRNTKLPWWTWDLSLIKDLHGLTCLNIPLLVGLSRKSFLGHVLNEKNPALRLAGSLAATAIAVMQGASLIRTHDVAETKKAIILAQAIRGLKTK